jgi:hypothetical protein
MMPGPAARTDQSSMRGAGRPMLCLSVIAFMMPRTGGRDGVCDVNILLTLSHGAFVETLGAFSGSAVCPAFSGAGGWPGSVFHVKQAGFATYQSFT